MMNLPCITFVARESVDKVGKRAEVGFGNPAVQGHEQIQPVWVTPAGCGVGAFLGSVSGAPV